MPVSDTQLAEASALLDQHIAVAAEVKATAATAAREAWEASSPITWYEVAATAALASEMAQMSTAGQDVIAGSAQSFIGHVVAVLAGTRVTIPRTTLPPVRRGVDLRLAHTRPAEAYKKAIAQGKPNQAALNIAYKRAEDMQVADISLADRNAQQELMRALGVVQFRRITRPELSKTGSCGLCIAASGRVYSVAELMPLHPPTCNCVTMPVIGDNDPGVTLNEDDLRRLYDDAGGSTKRGPLSNTRYKVNEHGEFGPVLTREGDSFRGPSKVALEDDPERAARMLAKTLPVLQQLEAREAAGESVSRPLAYQRDLVARLRRIVGA